MSTLHITPMTAAHWPEVAAIYQEGINTGNATFETQPPVSWEIFSERKINTCCIVAQKDGKVVGWAALSPAFDRCVYAGVVEVSVYVAQDARGKGIGSRLLQELIHISEKMGIWTLQTGIFPENQTSLRLHHRYGFRQVGVRKKLGKMEYGPFQGQWRDVAFLERRSQIVGVEP